MEVGTYIWDWTMGWSSMLSFGNQNPRHTHVVGISFFMSKKKQNKKKNNDARLALERLAI